MSNLNAVKEILIISGLIMLAFAYRSFAEWYLLKDKMGSHIQKKQDTFKT